MAYMNYSWQIIKYLLFLLPLHSANTIAQGTLDLESRKAFKHLPKFYLMERKQKMHS